MDDLFLGWTCEQWALATVGEDPKNIQDAIKIKREYIKTHTFAPIEKGVIIKPEGVSRQRNWEAACRVMELIYNIGEK